MGKFKDQGDAELQLLEELAEMTQVIAKKLRFNGEWNEIPPGKEISRLQELMNEMQDVMHAYERVIDLSLGYELHEE